MADIGQTNTYDSNVSWHFHESYYFGHGITKYWDGKEYKGVMTWSQFPLNETLEYYVFRRDQFGEDTYELVCNFSNNFSYYLYNYDDIIVVFTTDPRVEISDEEATYQYSSNQFITSTPLDMTVDRYIRRANYWDTSYCALPGDSYVWDSNGEEINVSPTPEPTVEPTTTPTPEPTVGPTPEPTGTPYSGGDDPSQHTDIDDYTDVAEILKEIYKQDTQYQTDMLEVQRNSFDFQVVQLSVSFITVFLCGILVGCAFARSLWHKMNVG